MRMLKRNKTTFWYALYVGTEQSEDEYGNVISEQNAKFTKPVAMQGHVSIAYGLPQQEQFGTNTDYDKLILIDDMSCPIDEYSVLCVDREPSYDDGNLQFDYVVKRVARSFNSITLAIRKRETS